MERKNTFDIIYKKIRESTTTPEFPYLIDVELTNACNLNCKMCSRQLMEREVGYISDELITKLVNECKQYDCGIRFIRWGEPFLHRKLIRYVEQFKSAGIPIHITNNGMVITEEEIKKLIGYELDSIIFSMQGLSPKEYESIREGAEHNKLVDIVSKFVELRWENRNPYIHITTTIDEHNEDDEKTFTNFWKKWVGVDKVSIGITNYYKLNKIKSKDIDYIHCKEPYKKLGVDWDGKVTACCSDYDNLMTIGDLNKQSIYDIWNDNKELECIRHMLDNKRNRTLSLCRGCFPAYGNLSNNTSKKGK